MDSTIARIYGREILDSAGNPTVEVGVDLVCGARARAGVPSGASTGSREAVELRDGDPHRYGGKGVRQAVAGIEETIAPSLIGMDASDQAQVEAKMIALDGTDNKARHPQTSSAPTTASHAGELRPTDEGIVLIKRPFPSGGYPSAGRPSGPGHDRTMKGWASARASASSSVSWRPAPEGRPRACDRDGTGPSAPRSALPTRQYQRPGRVPVLREATGYTPPSAAPRGSRGKSRMIPFGTGTSDRGL